MHGTPTREEKSDAGKEWRHQLRSSLHPTLFAAAYLAADALAALLGLPAPARAQLLLAAPKALQAVVAACIDLSTLALAERLHGPDDPATWLAVRRPFLIVQR
jgi:phosphatidylinositol glycan class B